MECMKESEFCFLTNYENMGMDTCSDNNSGFWKEWQTGRKQARTKPKQKTKKK